MFGFLPVVLSGYFILNRLRLIHYAKVWLTLASIVFYGYWNIKYVPLILLSILFNYSMGHFIHKAASNRRRLLLIFSLSANILLLGYYKYTDFFIENWNELTGSPLKS